VILETWSDLQSVIAIDSAHGWDWRWHVKAQMGARGLTGREQEIVWEIFKGFSNKEVANALFITESTVKNHMSTIMRKLNTLDRGQVILLLLGIIDITPPEKPPLGAASVTRPRSHFKA
jgi:DNA-binding NarL/FixJ family response regulator